MPRPKLIIALIALLLSTLACVTLLGEESTPRDSLSVSVTPNFPPTPIAVLPPEPVSCPLITERIIEANTPPDLSSSIAKNFYNGVNDDDTIYLAIYRVSGNELGEPHFEPVSANLEDEQNDTATHRRIWEYFAGLVPLEYRPTLAEFAIMTDGRENILAAVSQTYYDPKRWGLEVDIADTDDYSYLTFTLIHEFAHLFTLAPDQVPPSLAIFNNPEDNDIYLDEVSACPTFFPGEGCSAPNSYINTFYERFWLDLYDEWNEINLIEDEDDYYDALDEFYFRYEDQFLTDYSVTHPAEDIAEAFGFFIFAEEPTGNTIAEQKILFFHQYPELVQLRTEIISNLCAAFPQ